MSCPISPIFSSANEGNGATGSVCWPETCFVTGAHFNPVVTLALLVNRKVSPIKTFLFITAQGGGAIAGAALLYGSVLLITIHSFPEKKNAVADWPPVSRYPIRGRVLFWPFNCHSFAYTSSHRVRWPSDTVECYFPHSVAGYPLRFSHETNSLVGSPST